MRDYARLSPGFWIGHTGRLIRERGRDAQVVAVYLLSAPQANMIGLYYLPLPTLCHETGILHKEALKALRSLYEAKFAEYDPASEVVWVYNMARYQIAEQLEANDKRCKGVWRELSAYKHTKFFRPFSDRYRSDFHLPPLENLDQPGSPIEAPSKTLRSQDQEQDQDQEQEQDQKNSGGQVPMLAARPKSEMTWNAYAEAYQKRYGVMPVRNAKINSQCCQLVSRLGAEEAPLVAAFYLHVDMPLYVSARHATSLLVRDCEGLRTQWKTGGCAANGRLPRSMVELIGQHKGEVA